MLLQLVFNGYVYMVLFFYNQVARISYHSGSREEMHANITFFLSFLFFFFVKEPIIRCICWCQEISHIHCCKNHVYHFSVEFFRSTGKVSFGNWMHWIWIGGSHKWKILEGSQTCPCACHLFPIFDFQVLALSKSFSTFLKSSMVWEISTTKWYAFCSS